MPTLISKFADVAIKIPEQTALVFAGHKIEYGKLYEAILRLAQGLKDIGVKKGDRICLMMPNVPHFCISYYAILRIGAVAVPINYAYDQDEVEYHLRDSQAMAIIAWHGFYYHILQAAKKVQSCKEIIFLGENIPVDTRALTTLIASSKPLAENVEIAETDLAVINYTAGVAQEAMGCELTHDALFANAASIRDLFMISQEDKLLSIIPLFHPLGQSALMNAAFSTGASLILDAKAKSEESIKLIQENRITFVAGFPDHYKRLTELEDAGLKTPSLKHCLSYGGQLSEELIQAFEAKYDAIIYEAYGLSEAGSIVTSNRIIKDRKSHSVGLPLIGIEVQIRDEDGNLLRAGESGEIWVKSPGNMRGYFNRPESTATKLKNGWLFTGDIGYLDDDFYLFVKERKENIVLKGGFQIFPKEIEGVMIEHPAVKEVAVIPIPDEIQGSEAKAFVVLKESQSLSGDDLKEFCKQTLPIYKIPKYVEFVASLPKSATGRVLKRKLWIDKKNENKSIQSSIA